MVAHVLNNDTIIMKNKINNNSRSSYRAFTYRGSRAIRRANLRLRPSFLANYIQTMVKLVLNYH
jgi:hypothetical protein